MTDTKPLDRLRGINPSGPPQYLPPYRTLSAAWHQWSQAEVDAVTLAWAADRPLLVRGEPGTGKTQLARAVAGVLQWILEWEVIHSRFEPQELLFRFDSVQRLAHATAKVELNESIYWRPGVLWRAYGWQSAKDYLPEDEQTAKPEGHVVLIDEIDKADADVPNSLLEVLGQRSFRIEALNLPIGGPDGARPLVIFTTNEDRELPPAFLRRCVVLSLEPAQGSDYATWLMKRGEAHFGAQPDIKGREAALIGREVLHRAAQLLVRDRESFERANLSKPGLAEYLDLLYALHRLAGADAVKQGQWLDQLFMYAYRKHGTVKGFEEQTTQQLLQQSVRG